jgi:hypothetical protein
LTPLLLDGRRGLGKIGLEDQWIAADIGVIVPDERNVVSAIRVDRSSFPGAESEWSGPVTTPSRIALTAALNLTGIGTSR